MDLPPIPIAIVGLNFGRHILKDLRTGAARRWAEPVLACDADPARLAAMTAEHGVRGCASLDEVLADPAVRAVGLYTGPVGRAALIRRILAAGKDVMTTKPFEADPDAGLAVLHEARALGRVVHLNSPGPRPTPDLAQIQRWIAEHDLGRVVACRGEVWASYREAADGTWYDDPAKCPVAPVFRLGIYLINDLVRLCGPAESVQVVSSRLFTGRPTADNAQLGIRFADGAVAGLFASFCVGDGDHYRNSLCVNCERGTVYRNWGPERGADGADLSVVVQREDRRHVAARATVATASGAYDWEAFNLACHRRPPAGPETAPEEIVEALRVVQAMAEAERSGATAPVRRP